MLHYLLFMLHKKATFEWGRRWSIPLYQFYVRAFSCAIGVITHLSRWVVSSSSVVMGELVVIDMLLFFAKNFDFEEDFYGGNK